MNGQHLPVTLDLIAPDGDARRVWAPDVTRWDADPEYQRAVSTFIASRVVGGSPSDASVLQDAAGRRVLITTSRFYADGQARPGWKPAVVVIPLEDGVVLP